MPSKEETLAKMDAAAEIAFGALNEIVEDMSGTEQEGAEKLLDWIEIHYRTAGYKRLFSRGLFNGRNPFS